MTRDEAFTVTEMVAATWPTSRVWATEEIEAYVRGIIGLDCETLVHAVAEAQKHLEFRPSVAELRQFYRLRIADTRTERPAAPEPRKERVPLWVRRWVAARHLHAAFGRDPDPRRFPEQQDHADPDLDPMPADEWLEEAEHVTEAQVWKALRT